MFTLLTLTLLSTRACLSEPTETRQSSMSAWPEPNLVNQYLLVQICDLKFIQNKHATSVIGAPLRWLPRWSARQKYLDQSETQMCHNRETRSIWNAQASPHQQAPPPGKKSQRADLAIGKNNKNMILFVSKGLCPLHSLAPEKCQTWDENSIKQNE